MRDIGIRIQRYRLQRYRAPETIGEKARFGIAIALGLWGIWALFLSDHSAVKILSLEGKKKKTEVALASTQREVTRGEQELRAANDLRVAERWLRSRHNFAHEGEILYVIQSDGGANHVEIPADSTR